MKAPTASFFAAVALLAACTTPTADPGDPAARTGAQIATAATTPLSDLNLVNAPIPQVLLDALRAPYATPADTSCDALVAQVKALDSALGTDLDAPAPAADPGLLERDAELIGSTTADTVRASAEGVVPFRRWVRRLTGAERYSKEVAAAIAAGTVRRSFLKGFGQARGCAAPASPMSPSARR
jgi:hypothetical protein